MSASASVVNSFADDAVIHYFLPRLGRVDTVYRAEPYEPANLVRYLVRRTKIWQFPLVVSFLCIVTKAINSTTGTALLAFRAISHGRQIASPLKRSLIPGRTARGVWWR